MIEARPSLRSAVAAAICIAAIFLLVAGASAARGPAKSPAGDKAVPGELIVRFAAGTTEAQRERALERAGAKAARSLAKQHTKLARTAKADTDRALKLLRSDPAVEYAEPNHRYHASVERIPNDPSFAQLWGMRNGGQAVNGTTGSPDADIDADEAWAVTTGSSDVVVAVIDTGVDFTHPDLAGSQWTNPGESCAGCRTDGVDNDGNGYIDDWRGWDFVNDDNDPFDDEGHGTHVAGTIGAVGDNGVGVTGVAWNARIMALKFLDATGGGSLDDALEAIRYATAMRVPITNNSWGGGFFSQALLDAIEEADAAGSLFVAAAGNEGSDLDVYESFPASYRVPNIVSVAASDQGDALADFSNYGRSGADLSAPGTNVYSTIPGGGYDWYDGTSMATPHVAGAAALAKAAHPAATAVGLKSLLLRSVDTPAGLAGKVATDGRLNVATAVSCSAAPRVWIEQPGAGFKSAVGDAVPVVAIGTSCGAPAGTTLTATANGEAIQLVARGDGVYTGTYAPTAAGPVSVSATAVTAAGSDTRTVTGVANLNYRITDGPYAWVDATVGGTKLALGDDTASSVALPFPFRYYGTDYSSVKVGSNGLLVFGADPATDYMNSPLPDPFEPNGVVAPYWDDLNPSVTGAGVWYRTVGTAPNRRFVVAWVAVPAYAGGNGVTFEVILEEATKDIVYQYKDVDHGYYEWDWGASATVGVEDAAGDVGRVFSYDSASLQHYQGLKSIRLSIGSSVPPPPPGPDTTPPAAPAGLQAQAGNASVQLDWADNAEADLAGYGVELRNGDGTWSPLATVPASSFTHTGLVNDVAHAYRVVARDAAGNVSAPSATVTATPVARVTYAPGSYAVVTGSLVGGSLASLAADDGSRLAVDARKLSRRNFRAELTASVTLPADRVASLRSLAIAYDGHVSTSGAALRVRVLNRRTGLWETIDGPRTGVTSDRAVSWAAPVAADYVSASGQVRVGAYAESSSDFVLRTDLVSVTIE